MSTATECTVATAPATSEGEKSNECQDCNNSTDPITLEDLADIPAEFLFKVKDGGVTHCFDIRSLHQYYQKCGKLENPLNREVFSEDTLDAFLKKIIQLGLTTEEEPLRRPESSSSSDDDFHLHHHYGHHRHHRHRGGGRRSNVNMSQSVMEIMNEAENPITRALRRHRHLLDPTGPTVSMGPRPTPVRRQPRPRPKVETHPMPRPDREITALQAPLPNLRERQDQRQSILDASRPSGGGHGLPETVVISQTRPTRPPLQPYYESQHPPQPFQPAPLPTTFSPRLAPQPRPTVSPRPQPTARPRPTAGPRPQPQSLLWQDPKVKSQVPTAAENADSTSWILLGLLLALGTMFVVFFFSR